jgi:hypothetical protein
MHLIKSLLKANVSIGFVAFLASTAFAAEILILTSGKPDGKRADIMFSRDKSSDRAIVIKTTKAGVAGSRLFLEIDRAKQPLFTYIFAEQDCKFEETTGSICELAIAGSDRRYGQIVSGFKRAKTLHIGVETAGSMAMSEDVSLKGFTRSYDKL